MQVLRQPNQSGRSSAVIRHFEEAALMGANCRRIVELIILMGL